MGHTVNPISNRLRINLFWNSSWCSYNNINYKYLLLADLKFYKFVCFLARRKILIKLGIVLGNWILLCHNSKCILLINYLPLKSKIKNRIHWRLVKQFRRTVKKYMIIN